MADEDKSENAGNVKKILTWLQIVSTIIILAAVPGQWYVYRDRQERTDAAVKQLQDFKEKRVSETDGKFANLNTAQSNFLQFIETQKELNRKLESHLTDKSIHVTEEQMRNLVVSQLSPLTVAMGKMEVTTAGQQKQLDRMETMLTNVLDAVQRDKVNAKKDADR